MKYAVSIAVIGLLALSTVSPAYAQEMESSDMLSLSAGIWDVGDDDEATDFRLEYRWGSPFFWQIKPFAAGEVTTDGSFWAGAGIYADLEVADRLVITPSFGAGLYDEGSSDLDLDYPLEFRSQIEAGYRFDNNNRVSVAFSHLSNASLGDDNPGTEVLGVYWHLPVNQVFH